MVEPITTAIGAISGSIAIFDTAKRIYKKHANDNTEIDKLFESAFNEALNIKIEKSDLKNTTIIEDSVSTYFQNPNEFVLKMSEYCQKDEFFACISQTDLVKIQLIVENTLSNNGTLEILSKIVEEIFKTVKYLENRDKIVPTIVKEEYTKNPNHLNRKVISKEDKEKYDYFFQDKASTLLKQLENEKYITLLGNAGDGKTYELKNLAYDLSNCENENYVFYVMLNEYTGEEIGEFIKYDCSRTEISNFLNYEENVILILDGFDELLPKHKEVFSRKITKFKRQYKDVKIVVSSRINLYNTETENNSATIKEFKSFYLCPLNIQQVRTYVEKNQTAFMADKVVEYTNSNFDFHFITNPFNLINLVDYINEKNSFPETKINLYKYLVQQSIYLDKEKFEGEQDRIEFQVQNLLKKVALIMETHCTNRISRKDLLNNFDKFEVDSLKLSSLFEKYEKNSEIYYQFKHNIYQEYLAASVLAEKDFETIKSFIAFEDEEEIIPSWINTIAYLMDILARVDSSKQNKLTILVMKSKPEILIKSEQNILSSEARFRIFTELFLEYKKDCIFFSLNGVFVDDLIRFCNNNDLVQFLINELNIDNKRNARYSAIFYLMNIQNIDRYSYFLKPKLEQILKYEQNVEITRLALDIIANNDIFLESEVRIIIEKYRKCNNDRIFASVIRLLSEYNLYEEYIDYIIHGLDLVDSNIGDINKSIYLGLEDIIKDTIKRISSFKALLKLLEWYSVESRLYNSYLYDNELLEYLIEISIEHYSTNNDKRELINIFTSFVQKYSLHLSDNRFPKILKFFVETNTYRDLIDYVIELYTIKQNIADLVIFNLMKENLAEEVSNVLLRKLKEYKIDRILVSNILSMMYYQLKESYDKVIKDFLRFDANLFNKEKSIVKRREDYIEEVARRDYENFTNKEYWIKEIEKVYLFINVEKETDFERKVFIGLDNKIPDLSILVYDYLKIFRTLFPKKEILEDLNNNFRWRVIERIYRILKNDTYNEDKLLKQVRITDSRYYNWIKDWCNNVIEKFGFHGKILNTHPISSFFVYKLKLEYSTEIMLKTLTYTFDNNVFDYVCRVLIKRNEERKLKNKIKNNLKNRIESNEILGNHIEYCKDNGIYEALDYCYEILTSEDEGYYQNRIKRTAFEAIKTLDLDYNKIIEDFLKYNEDTQWMMVEDFIEKAIEEEFVRSFLVEKLDSENHKYRAAKTLIKLQYSEGIKFYYDLVKESKNWGIYDIEGNLFSSIVDPSLIPEMLRFLELYLTKDIKYISRYERMIFSLSKGLDSLALKSNDSYKTIREGVIDLKEKYKEEISDDKLAEVNYYLRSVKEKYYINKQTGLKIGDVVRKVNEVS